MKDMIDLLIVGAGPAGLMTAKRAAQLGLKVTVVELKKDITKVKRACSAQFVMDEGYENETVKIEDNKVIFTNNGFHVNYSGPFLNITDSYYHSPNGHKIHFANNNKRPFAIKFLKGTLLKDLWNECEKLGVNLVLDTIAYDGKDLGDYVEVYTKSKKSTSIIKARKLVIAEGANAKLTGIFGFNKNRTLYGMPLVFSCIIEGTTGFEPNSWNQFYSSKYHPFAEIIVESAIEGKDSVEVTIMGTKDMKPETLFEKLLNDSPMSHHFKNARLIERKGCALKSFDSLLKPYKNNVLVIGDSSAHVEVIVQGALMCGYNAANAVNDELNNKNGFEKYTKWWNDAFDFNCDNSLEFVKLYGTLSLYPKYSDDELDYIFSLLEGEVLKGNFSQFQTPKTLWKAIMCHKDKIKIENPDLYRKMQNIDELNISGKLD